MTTFALIAWIAANAFGIGYLFGWMHRDECECEAGDACEVEEREARR